MAKDANKKAAQREQRELTLPNLDPSADAVRGGMSHLSIDEMLEQKEAPRVFEHFCLDFSLITDRDQKRATLRTLQLEAGRRLDDEGNIAEQWLGPISEAEKELAEAQAAVEAKSVTFEFVSIGREQVEKLMELYPPTKQQLDGYLDAVAKVGAPKGKGLQYDTDRFPIALIGSSTVTPRMTYQQAEKLWKSETFTRAELARIFGAAWGVNNIIAS